MLCCNMERKCGKAAVWLSFFRMTSNMAEADLVSTWTWNFNRKINIFFQKRLMILSIRCQQQILNSKTTNFFTIIIFSTKLKFWIEIKLDKKNSDLTVYFIKNPNLQLFKKKETHFREKNSQIVDSGLVINIWWKEIKFGENCHNSYLVVPLGQLLLVLVSNHFEKVQMSV